MWGKVWAWLKKYWKWLLFPIGLTGLVVAFFAGKACDPQDPDPPDVGEAGEDALDDVEEANRLRDAALEELRAAHHERLKDLTEEQAAELKELQDQPVENVVAWFNRLR
jgi:hypothetical protein